MSVHAATALAFGSKVKPRDPTRCGLAGAVVKPTGRGRIERFAKPPKAYAWRPRPIRASALGSGYSSSLPGRPAGRRPKHRFLLEYKE